MDYFYAAVWLIISIILIFKISKVNKIFYLLGAYFLFMSGWWVANALTPDINLLEGQYSIFLRAIGFVVLAIVLIFYYTKIYKRGNK